MKKVSFIIGLIVVFGLLLTFQNVGAAETKAAAEVKSEVKKTGDKAAEVKDKTAAEVKKTGDKADEAKAKVVYHGNKNSKVFHAPGCKDYDCKNCTEKFASKDDAVKAGYKSHKTCVK